MLDPWSVLKKIRFTEKSNELSSSFNCYTFEVYTGVNSLEIGAAVEQAFKVKVKSVRVLNRKPKVRVSRVRKYRPGSVGAMKKAMVTLAVGHKINMV